MDFIKTKNTNYLRRYGHLLLITMLIAISPLLWIILLPYRLLIVLISQLNGKYGKVMSFSDAFLDEDFVNHIPKGGIVTTIELKGDIPVEHVRSIFQENVLNQGLSNDPKSEKRYPEFQQYPTKLLGYRVWKNDPKFLIEDHVREEKYFLQNNNDGKCRTLLDISKFHEVLLNRPFKEDKSPWEIILVRNVIPVDGLIESDSGLEIGKNANPVRKTVLTLRLHHVMGDAKSILSVLVEGLGQKGLVTAEARPNSEKPILEKMIFPMNFLVDFVALFLQAGYLTFKNHQHPWKVSYDDKSKQIVKFSQKFLLEEVKTIARRYSVTTSAVIISLVTGAIRASHEKVDKAGVVSGYILPKLNHPKVLANHMHGAVTELPTDESFPFVRLKKSNDAFKAMRQSNVGLCWELLTYQLGTLPSPLRNILAVNHCAPILITNIAGEKEDFFIGRDDNGKSLICTEVRMSVGVTPGCAGLIFCILSYKDGFRVAVVGKESVISEEEVTHLVNSIGTELDILKCL